MIESSRCITRHANIRSNILDRINTTIKSDPRILKIQGAPVNPTTAKLLKNIYSNVIGELGLRNMAFPSVIPYETYSLNTISFDRLNTIISIDVNIHKWIDFCSY